MPKWVFPRDSRYCADLFRSRGSRCRQSADIIVLERRQAFRFYFRLGWRGSFRVRIASDDLGIDFPLQLILKQARAVKSRIGHERTQVDNFAAARLIALLRLRAGGK